MKHCYKWMAACVAVGLVAFLILPMVGVPIAGTSLLFPLLMVGCCVLPMLFMVKSGQKAEGHSCCSKPIQIGDVKNAATKTKSQSGCCH